MLGDVGLEPGRVDDELRRDVRADAVGLVEALRAATVSAPELVDAAIARAEVVNPELNGLAYEAFEQAKARARLRRPYGGFFDGVPSFLKDNVAVAGMPTMNGTDAWDPRPADADGLAHADMSGKLKRAVADANAGHVGLQTSYNRHAFLLRMGT